MPNLNKVTLMGNVTRPIEIAYTPKGAAVVDLTIAINRKWKSEAGEPREEVTFVDVQLWKRLAEIAEEYVLKGDPILIEGRLQLDTWEDKTTGQKRSRMRVVAENLQLIAPCRTPAAADAARDRQSAPASKPAGSKPPAEPEDDDIPF